MAGYVRYPYELTSALVDDDDEFFATVGEAQALVLDRWLARQYASWMKDVPAASPIDFYDEVRIDKYGTVTLGVWGGYLVQVMPMLFNDRLVLTPERQPLFHDYGWCYDKGPAAVLAARVWDPQTQGEPVGFKKRVMGEMRSPGEHAGDRLTAGAERAMALLVAFGADVDDLRGDPGGSPASR